MNDTTGDYLVFADESGDHSLIAHDPDYPIFVFAMVVFRSDDYFDDFLPKFHRLKFKTFGHDSAILHERDIRRREGAFRFLHGQIAREEFLESLNALIASAKFEVFHWVFDKRSQANSENKLESIYAEALHATLPRLLRRLDSKAADKSRVSLIFESRGRLEDSELKGDFLAFQKQYRALGSNRLDLHFVSKAANTAGVQLADLAARPLGLEVLLPNQTNRALEIVRAKVANG